MNSTEKYGLPLDIKFCKECTRSNQRPAVTQEFLQTNNQKKNYVELENNICGGCKFNHIKNNIINWNEREKKLEELCKKFRKNDGHYDVLVPGSGGKDSIYVAHQLKYKYKMNPLLCSWSPTIITKQGKKNLKAWIDLGFNIEFNKVNKEVHRVLTKLAFLNLCHPFQPFIIGQKNFAPRVAQKNNIQLIMFGEHDAEFGSDLERWNKPTMNLDRFTQDKIDYKEIFLGGVQLNEILKKYNFTIEDIKDYLPIESDKFKSSKAEFHYYSYYKKWNFHDNYYYVLKNSNFLPEEERIQGSYDKYASMDDKIDYLHFYTYYIKFGMGRATSATEQEIRAGVINRDEGIALVKRFDSEFPSKYFPDFLEYMQIDERQFQEVIEKSRPEHLWKKDGKEWKLKKPIWGDG
tara:strand:- start:352 stop:1566 length:1215 start_codon:yes stop_codon:yes gene_type:complete